MHKTLKNFLYTVLLITIIVGILLVLILHEDVICLKGLRSFKIEEKDIPVWIKKQVNAELRNFKSVDKKTFAKLDQFIIKNKLDGLGHFKVTNNKVFLITGKSSEKCQKFKKKLEQILKVNTLGDLEFILYFLHDVHYGKERSFLLKKLKDFGIDTNNAPPIFAFAANKNAKDRKHFILVPDSYSVDTAIFNKYTSRWSCLSARVDVANSKNPWSSKKSKAFWRGGSVRGASYNKREIAVRLSREYPQLLDARYAPPFKSEKNFWNRKAKYFCKFFNIEPWAYYNRFINHKIILDLEGHTISYQGVYWKLFSNSVVFRQSVGNESWASSQFIPWIHFVPIKEDLSDLIDKIYWVKDHDDEARKIAYASTNFMKQNIMPKHIDMYIYYVLKEYSKLLQ
ncbi:MAG: hypothetical protein HRU36_05335 [Rickettsiales bacterium]|nr:hypothetical protein [Rickettsiales bacterium]